MNNTRKTADFIDGSMGAHACVRDAMQASVISSKFGCWPETHSRLACHAYTEKVQLSCYWAQKSARTVSVVTQTLVERYRSHFQSSRIAGSVDLHSDTRLCS